MTLNMKTLSTSEKPETVKFIKYAFSRSHRLLDLKDEDTVSFRNVGKNKIYKIPHFEKSQTS